MHASIKAMLNLILILSLISVAISAAITSRIYHGDKVNNITEFPFVVSVYHFDQFLCGGVIIRNDVVLTAAHCEVFYREITKVVAGRTSRKNKPNTVQVRKVATVIVHEKFCSAPQGFVYDLAIVLMTKPLHFNIFVNAIKLPEENSPMDKFTNELATIAGWGYTERNRLSDDLLAVNLTVLSFAECRDRMYGLLEASPNGICAIDKASQGKTVCFGDSGSGLFIANGSDPREYVLVGITSLVMTNMERCLSEYPIGFTSVIFLEDFIKDYR